MLGEEGKARGRNKTIALTTIIVGISGAVLVLTGGLELAGNSTLGFLLSGLGFLNKLPDFTAGMSVIILGLALVWTAVGLWRLKMWALITGLTISLLQILISLSSHDFTSFIFIRGVIVFALLLRFQGYFRIRQ
jgi:hypothetical protein